MKFAILGIEVFNTEQEEEEERLEQLAKERRKKQEGQGGSDDDDSDKKRTQQMKKEVQHQQRHSRKQLAQIFGSWFIGKGYSEMSNLERENTTNRIQKTLSQLSRIKQTLIPIVQFKSTHLLTPVFLANLLYQEAQRILNEHSMRLLLEHSFKFQRHVEEPDVVNTQVKRQTSSISEVAQKNMVKGTAKFGGGLKGVREEEMEGEIGEVEPLLNNFLLIIDSQLLIYCWSPFSKAACLSPFLNVPKTLSLYFAVGQARDTCQNRTLQWISFFRSQECPCQEGDEDPEQFQRDLISAMLISKKMSEFKPANVDQQVENQPEQPEPQQQTKTDVFSRISEKAGTPLNRTPLSTGKIKGQIQAAFKERLLQKSFAGDIEPQIKIAHKKNKRPKIKFERVYKDPLLSAMKSKHTENMLQSPTFDEDEEHLEQRSCMRSCDPKCLIF